MSIFASKEKDGTLDVLVCGKVQRDPEHKETQKGAKVRFSVNYGKKKYMDVEAWLDSHVGTIAAMLERDDVVAVAGTHRFWEYNGKTYQSVDADFITVMGAQNVVQSIGSQDNPMPDKPPMEEITEDDGELPF